MVYLIKQIYYNDTITVLTSRKWKYKHENENMNICFSDIMTNKIYYKSKAIYFNYNYFTSCIYIAEHVLRRRFTNKNVHNIQIKQFFKPAQVPYTTKCTLQES